MSIRRLILPRVAPRLPLRTVAIAIGWALVQASAGAQPRGGPPGPDHSPGWHGDRRDDRRDDSRGRPRPGDREGHQDLRPDRMADRGGFPQPRRDWRTGGYVPGEYRGRNYVIDDWRGNGLRQPPRGYQWVGVGGDFVLAAIATGLIASIISH